jgi:fatty acid desaturase
MKRYKLLTQDGYAAFNFLKGEVYADTAKSKASLTVSYMAKTYPADWQLIEEKQEKRPIMTYVILLVMMVLYLYAGLAEINWPLWPATVLGFYLLFKIEQNGQK